MDGQEEIGVEWRSLERKAWSALLHGVIGEFDILGEFGLVVSSADWLDTPIDEHNFTLIRGRPERWSRLIGLEQDPAEPKLSRTILLEKVKLGIWLPNILWRQFQGLLVNRSGIPNVDDTILRDGDKVGVFALGGLSSIDVIGWWNEGNVTNKVLMRSNDTRLAQMLHLDDGLRLVVIISGLRLGAFSFTTCFLVLGSRSDSMILR